MLYRSNIQAKILEEELRTAEVPYVMYGGQQFFERKEVKDVIAYLRVALNPRDELALRRVINYPARGIGATTVEKLVHAAQAEHATLWEALATTEVHGGREATASTRVRRRSSSASKAALEAGHDIVAATKALIEDIELYDDLRARRGEHVGGAAPHRQRRGPARLAAAVRREGQGPSTRSPSTCARCRSRRKDDKEAGRRRQGRADDAARREGPRVPGVLHDRPRGGAAAARAHAPAAGDRRHATPITRPTSARSAGCATSASRARSASCT